jgi:small subunit ribosomal protein S6
MRFYELIYILNSNVEHKKIDQVMKDIGSRLEKTESKIINHIVWGKKKLAYPIKGNTYGNYILLHYEGGDNNKLNEFDSWLKLSGLVIRHMIVRLEEKPDLVKDFGDEKLENDSEKKPEELAEDKDKNKEQLEKEIVQEDKETE